jgi:hypothetical protein
MELDWFLFWSSFKLETYNFKPDLIHLKITFKTKALGSPVWTIGRNGGDTAITQRNMTFSY